MASSVQRPPEPVLSVTAWVFSLTFVETRHLLGVALICPDARYASVLWMDERIEPRHLTSSIWISVEADLDEGFDPGPVSKSRPVARVLSGSRGAVLDVEFIRQRTVQVGTSASVAEALDKMLKKERPD
jgi:hypothetical protein